MRIIWDEAKEKERIESLIKEKTKIMAEAYADNLADLKKTTSCLALRASPRKFATGDRVTYAGDTVMEMIIIDVKSEAVAQIIKGGKDVSIDRTYLVYCDSTKKYFDANEAVLTPFKSKEKEEENQLIV